MILLALLLLAASPGQPDYERANQLFVAQKFPEALAAVDASLRLDPDLVPALTLKAKLAMAANRYAVARQALEHALAINPKAPYAQFLYGLEAFMNNEMKEALPRFRKARELSTADPRAALDLGLVVESVGDPQEALGLYREAVSLEKASGKPQADTLLQGVRLLMLLGRLDEAEVWVRQAVTLAPQLRDAHFELARLLLKKNAAAAAAQEGELALTVAGTVSDTAIHYLLNRAWRQAGDPERAGRHAAVIRAQGGR